MTQYHLIIRIGHKNTVIGIFCFQGKTCATVSFIWNILREYVSEHIFKTNGLLPHLNIPAKSSFDQETNEVNQKEKRNVEATLLYSKPE